MADLMIRSKRKIIHLGNEIIYFLANYRRNDIKVIIFGDCKPMKLFSHSYGGVNWIREDHTKRKCGQ